MCFIGLATIPRGGYAVQERFARHIGSASTRAGGCLSASKPPKHDAQLESLARIEGQVRGIRGMIVERRYCIDILTQTRAVHAALRRVEREVLTSYLNTCARAAFEAGPEEERQAKVEEILALFDWENGKPR